MALTSSQKKGYGFFLFIIILLTGLHIAGTYFLTQQWFTVIAGPRIVEIKA